MKLLLAITILACASWLPAQPIPLAPTVVNPTIAEAGRLMGAKDSTAAISLLKGEIEKQPANTHLRMFLSGIYSELRRFDDAIAQVREALKVEPNSVNALTGLGDLYFRKGDRPGAAAAFDRAANATSESASALIAYSGGYMETGQFELAQLIDEALLRMRPDSPVFSNNLSYTLAEQNKDLAHALELIEFAMDRQPGVPAFIDTLGWVYFKLGRVDEALGPLCSALSMEVELDAYQQHVLKVLDAIARPTPDQRSLRNWLRTDNDPERNLRVEELAYKLAR